MIEGKACIPPYIRNLVNATAVNNARGPCIDNGSARQGQLEAAKVLAPKTQGCSSWWWHGQKALCKRMSNPHTRHEARKQIACRRGTCLRKSLS